jgi:hypothetical protein
VERFSYLFFFNDVSPTYRKGLVLRRLYKDKPFSEEAPLLKDNLIQLTYKGETLYLSELADKYDKNKIL